MRNFRELYEDRRDAFRNFPNSERAQGAAASQGIILTEGMNDPALQMLAMYSVISEPIECAEWVRYLPGTDPKEHREQIDRSRAREERRMERRADQRARRKELRIARDAADATKMAARLQLAAVVLAAVAILVSAAVALLDDDSAAVAEQATSVSAG